MFFEGTAIRKYMLFKVEYLLHLFSSTVEISSTDNSTCVERMFCTSSTKDEQKMGTP
jgi:hypothetical protein